MKDDASDGEFVVAGGDGTVASERPSSATTKYGIGAHERPGSLMPEAPDKWWIIGPGTEPGALADEIVSMIDCYGAPWLQALV